MQAVSSHLCRGSPFEAVGSGYVSPLKLAVTTNRSQIVTLLLACGAMLPAGLLQEAWQSPDVTSGVLATLTTVGFTVSSFSHHRGQFKGKITVKRPLVAAPL